MGELEEKLEQILGNPDAMQQIMSLARSLGKDAPQSQPGASPPPPRPESAQPGLQDALAQLDPRLLAGAARLMGEYTRADDSRAALLTALRPFVKERRYARLDKAIQIAKLSRLVRMALELLRTREDADV